MESLKNLNKYRSDLLTDIYGLERRLSDLTMDESLLNDIQSEIIDLRKLHTIIQMEISLILDSWSGQPETLFQL